MNERIKIGINPLTWTNDDLPALGGETGLEVCLSEGKQAGFSGFELGQKFPRDAKLLKPILEKHNLELVSGWFSGKILQLSVEEEINRLEAHVELLKAMHCEVMVYCDISMSIQGQLKTGLSKRPRLVNDQWHDFARKLSQIAEYTHTQGIKLAYHHHMGTIVQTAEEVDRLMEFCNESVFLLLDAGHLFYAGGDPLKMVKRYGDRIVHVHCKDIRHDVMSNTINRDRSFLQGVLDGVFAVPGDGCIDFEAIFKQLVKDQYAGWLVIEAEQDPVVAPSLATAKRGFNQVCKYAKNAGLV